MSAEADIEERLRCSLQARARTFVLTNPEEPPPCNLTRSRPRQHPHSAVTHVLVGAAVAAVVALALVLGPFRPGMSRVPARIPAAHPSLSVSIPKGWKTYTYKQAAISVPSSWRINGCPDPSVPGTLDLGEFGLNCPSFPQSTLNEVSLSTLSSSLGQMAETHKPTICSTRVNRLAIYVVACDIPGNLDFSTEWLVPSLDVEVTALPKETRTINESAMVERVLHTLRAADNSSTGVVTGAAQACAALAYVATARLAVYRGDLAVARNDEYRQVVPVAKMNVPTNGPYRFSLSPGHYFITNTGNTEGAHPFVISAGHTVYVNVPDGCE